MEKKTEVVVVPETIDPDREIASALREIERRTKS